MARHFYATINNHFPVILTSLCCALCGVLLIFSDIRQAYADDSILTIENVKVDITAQNALEAREEAFNEAQVKAFTELTQRMAPDGVGATRSLPSVDVISSMIKDFELVSEQLSSVRYIGAYTFRFKKEAVESYFGNYVDSVAAAQTQSQSQARLVLPFLKTGSETILWDPANTWMAAWNRASGLQDEGVGLLLPVGDLLDIQDIDDDQALDFDTDKMAGMLKRYGAQSAVIAIASPQLSLQNSQINQVSVEIYEVQDGRMALVYQDLGSVDEQATADQLFDRAVVVTRDAMKRGWSGQVVTGIGSMFNQMRIIVPIASMEEWLNIQSTLGRIDVLNDIKVSSLTPRQAFVDLVFAGETQQLLLSLKQQGFSVLEEFDKNGSPVQVLRMTDSPTYRF